MRFFDDMWRAVIQASCGDVVETALPGTRRYDNTPKKFKRKSWVGKEMWIGGVIQVVQEIVTCIYSSQLACIYFILFKCKYSDVHMGDLFSVIISGFIVRVILIARHLCILNIIFTMSFSDYASS